jgi:transcriptional regulator with XRE-family HTH domain
MTLGEKIKFVRQRREMSQAELAKIIDVYQKNISRYEVDNTVPSAIILKKIAAALGVTTDFLLSENENEVTIHDQELANKFLEIQKLKGRARDIVIELMDLVIRDAKTRQAYSI